MQSAVFLVNCSSVLLLQLGIPYRSACPEIEGWFGYQYDNKKNIYFRTRTDHEKNLSFPTRTAVQASCENHSTE